MIYKFLHHSVMAEKFDNMEVNVSRYAMKWEYQVQQARPKIDLWSRSIFLMMSANEIPKEI